MSNKLKIIFTSIFIASCGGTTESYGALAINYKTGAAYLTAHHANESAAYQTALYRCGDGCTVVEEFKDSGQCMAVSRGTNLILGWKQGSNQKQIETESIAQCSNNGGVGCIMFLSFCN